MVPGDVVLTWFAAHGRDLPWRRTRDPWAILVSEVMLQQTQASRVAPAWEGFLSRFPTVAACAAAPVGEVVRAWAGLGYNRRGVNLHRAARAVVDRHGGEVPADLGALLALPGVGPYTARAVLAFAFEADVAVLDVNVARVLVRVAGDRSQPFADGLVPAGRAWSWNSALVDLGATVCTATRPACGVCPLLPECGWVGGAGGFWPDPAAPSTHQSRFAGSDRQGRGRLVTALRSGPVASSGAALAAAAGWPDDAPRAARIADSLVADGLAVRSADGAWLSLPGNR